LNNYFFHHITNLVFYSEQKNHESALQAVNLQGMNILVISKQTVNSLFGLPIPFTGTSVIVLPELPMDALGLYDLVIDLEFEEHTERKELYASFTRPVLLGSVLYTLEELGLHNSMVARFNHWPFFIDRNCIEFCCNNTHEKIFNSIFTEIHIVQYYTKDVVGFVSARVIANIVNEAFFAEDEQVSSKQEIDTAMKLGTNYPFGPFEWSSKIGLSNITRLLQKMAIADNRYQPAPNLLKEMNLQ
jgi:3-hydroxybutyryl-CoA dehydrogenase